ncbi:hypothetical protein [Roseiflexus sp.]|uniref:DUF7010 family protein n=1 Tax=Roseiflexus sp. TaxID=2562120 RepID=UPI0035B52F63
MRSAFLGGFAGQLVSGLIWLTAAGFATWRPQRGGMAVLFFGSMEIFPLTQLLVRLMGHPGRVSPENRLWALGSQVAFTVPLNFCWSALRPFTVKIGFPGGNDCDWHALPALHHLVRHEDVRHPGWSMG